MEITGKLQSKLQVEKGVSTNGKEWQKQSIIINTGSQYNPEICVTFFGDKVGLLNGLKKDENIVVSVNLSSREYNGRWFNSIDGYKIDKAISEPFVKAEVQTKVESDDLPF